MTGPRLPALVLLLAGAAACADHEAPAAVAEPARVELTPFEESVLFGLDNLKGRPETAAFLAEVGTPPDRARYLAGNPETANLARFKRVVEKYAADPSFRALLEASCGPGAKAESADEGCSPADPAAGALGAPAPAPAGDNPLGL